VQAGYQIRVTAFILDAALSWKNLNGLIYTQGGKTGKKGMGLPGILFTLLLDFTQFL